MTIKYRLSRHPWGDIKTHIEAVDVIRDTAKTVTLKVMSDFFPHTFCEQRQMKTDSNTLFDTWGEAHQALLDRQNARLLRLEEGIEVERAALTMFQAMQPTDFTAL